MNDRLVLGSPIDGLLDRLYARNVAQEDALATYFTARATEGALDWSRFDERTNEFLKDKLIALDRSKAEFCYHVCCALRARRVVEAGSHTELMAKGGLYARLYQHEFKGDEAAPAAHLG